MKNDKRGYWLEVVFGIVTLTFSLVAWGANSPCNNVAADGCRICVQTAQKCSPPNKVCVFRSTMSGNKDYIGCKWNAAGKGGGSDVVWC